MAVKYDSQTKHILEKYSSVIDSTKELGINDLPLVMQAMAPLNARWKNIGIMVGLNPNVLATIEANYNSNIASRFIDMIAAWLSSPDPDGPRPTWREVLIAMSRPAGGDNPSEAEQLAKLWEASGGIAFPSSCVDGVDDSEIGYKEMASVVAALGPVSTNWKAIGLLLGLRYETVKSLNGLKVSDCISQVVESWLNKRYDVQRFGAPSWKKLVEVIGASMGGASSTLASEIANDHPQKGTKRPHDQESEGEGADKKICLDASGKCEEKRASEGFIRPEGNSPLRGSENLVGRSENSSATTNNGAASEGPLPLVSGAGMRTPSHEGARTLIDETQNGSSACKNRDTCSEGAPSSEGDCSSSTTTESETRPPNEENPVHEADRRLKANKHSDVLRYIKKIGDIEALIELGQTLGLGRVPLTLKRSSPDILPGYLIDGWIRRDYEVLERTGEPTWRSLAKAMKEIGMTGISMDIQADFNFSL